MLVDVCLYSLCWFYQNLSHLSQQTDAVTLHHINIQISLSTFMVSCFLFLISTLQRPTTYESLPTVPSFLRLPCATMPRPTTYRADNQIQGHSILDSSPANTLQRTCTSITTPAVTFQGDPDSNWTIPRNDKGEGSWTCPVRSYSAYIAIKISLVPVPTPSLTAEQVSIGWPTLHHLSNTAEINWS